jgi:hypothetical protein
VRKTFVAIVMLGSLSAIVFASGPASATVSGFATFNCNVYLPIWPTQFGGPVHCYGTGNAVLAGKTTSGVTYRATGTNRPFDGAASFYNEKCTANEPLNGSAGGVTHISGLAGVPGGTANAHSPFSWTRVGVNAVILLPPGGTINFSNGSLAVGTGTGRAVAVFRQTTPRAGTRTCTAPGPQTANIVGLALFPS